MATVVMPGVGELTSGGDGGGDGSWRPVVAEVVLIGKLVMVEV